jgi:hypothetical protein
MLFRRSRLNQAAVDAVGWLLGALRAAIGQLPKGFWQNPYALGFIHGWAWGAAQVTLSPNNLLRTPTREDASQMILAVYEAYLPKEQVMPTARLGIDFHKQEHPAYTSGTNRALQIFLYSKGFKGGGADFERQIEEARKTIKLLEESGLYGTGDERGHIAGHLLFESFCREFGND